MNKLEQYRETYFDNLVKEAFGKEVPKEVFDKEKSLFYDFLKKGFDAVIALDLPVKFHKWMEDDMTIEEHEDFMNKYGNISDYNKFYQYWIENIYKPE